MFLFKATVNMFIIGDCLVSNLSRYINHGRLNLGIAGDNLQNFLWRKNNFKLLANSSLNYFFIHYGSNKSHHNSRQSIVGDIIAARFLFEMNCRKQLPGAALLKRYS